MRRSLLLAIAPMEGAAAAADPKGGD